MSSHRIALFPLELVLFPGASLPLHIFESRYKLMTRRCLERQLEFGVLLARPKGMAKVGCTAKIVNVVREYEDGRMDILTAGRTRYRVLKVIDERPYFEADVEYLPEGPEARPPASSARLLQLYEECHKFVFGHPPESLAAGPGASLAFPIAGTLPLDLDLKQMVLEAETEDNRQSLLLEHLSALLPRLARTSRVRAKAGGNGHGAS